MFRIAMIYLQRSCIARIARRLYCSQLNCVKGWLVGVRRHRQVVFCTVSDGHTHTQLLLAADAAARWLAVGTPVVAYGVLKPSQGSQQQFDLHVSSIKPFDSGEPAGELPLSVTQSDKAALDKARQQPHLRALHPLFAATLRLRSQLVHAAHRYYQERDYLHVDTPLLTSNDCEGAGSVFGVAARPAADSAGSSEPFFGRDVNLTVSGQLHLEALAACFARVYTMKPAFRAERSNTRHHLAEFVMLEAELSFVDEVAALMDEVEQVVRALLGAAAAHSGADLELIWRRLGRSDRSLDSLRRIAERPFARLSSDDACELLFAASPVGGDAAAAARSRIAGGDFSKDEERLLVQRCGGGPLFVHHFPASGRPFYMRTTDHQPPKACCFDLLFPEVGELCGGSLREQRAQPLRDAMRRQGVDPVELNWYLQLRQFGGAAPHGGYGIGFDRLVQFVAGLSNIRDATHDADDRPMDVHADWKRDFKHRFNGINLSDIDVSKLSPEDRWRVEHMRMHEKHHGHEKMHVEMVLVLLVTLVAAQVLLFQWRRRFFKSYQIATLLGMWLIPPLFCMHYGWMRFICVWGVFSLLTGIVSWKATRRRISPRTPRLVYRWFLFIYQASYALGLVGYCVMLATLFGLNLLLLIQPQVALDFGLQLLFYGLYFGVVGRDLAEVCTDKMATSIGYTTASGLPGKQLDDQTCAICASVLVPHTQQTLESSSDSESDNDGRLTRRSFATHRPVKPEKTCELSCGHVFHEFCIRGWCIVGKKETCPYCREKVDLRKMFRNPWERPHVLYGSLLDWVRYLVAWQPLIILMVQAFNFGLGLE